MGVRFAQGHVKEHHSSTSFLPSSLMASTYKTEKPQKRNANAITPYDMLARVLERAEE